MASNLPSSFASAAAGQNSNRDARGARDGRGNSSGEWSRQSRTMNGTLTFRRTSATPSSQAYNQPNTSDSTAAPDEPAMPVGSTVVENGASHRYSREGMYSIYKNMQRDRRLDNSNISSLFVTGWNPGHANGTAPRGWGKSGDSNVLPQEPDICWGGPGATTAVGLQPWTPEEKELFADVNSTMKPPVQNKEGGGTPLNGRKTSVTQAASNNYGISSPSTTSRPGTRRRETTDTNPFSGGGGGVNSPVSARPSRDNPPFWLERKNTDVKDSMFEEPQEDMGTKDAPSKPTPVPGLSRSNTATSSAAFGGSPSPWQTSSTGTGQGFGGFGNFALPSSTIGEKRPGNPRGESRLAHLLTRELSDTSTIKPGEGSATATVDPNRSWRPRPRTDTDPFGDEALSGSAVLGGAQDTSPPPLSHSALHTQTYDTPVKGSAGDFGMSGLKVSGHEDHDATPLSPAETNPYGSPPGNRGEHDEDADKPHGFATGGEPTSNFGGTRLQQSFPHSAFDGSDRSQTSSVGAKAPFPSLANLSGWPSSSTPDRERAPFPGFGNSLFGQVGDLQSPGLGNLGGVFGPATTSLGGSGSFSRGSKLGSLFPAAMQAQMQAHETDNLNDSIPDLRQANPLGAIGRNPLNDHVRETESPIRGGRGVFANMFAAAHNEANRAPVASEPGLHGGMTSAPGPSFTPTTNAPNYAVPPSEPPSAQSRIMVMPDRMRWTYLDPQGNVQGPFTGLEMNDWYKANFFTPDLRVKKLEDVEFEPLGQLIRRIGNSREPFLVPQIGIPHGPPVPNPFSPNSSGVIQPPLVGAFPSFGRTLTAEEQNNLERRKQEEQYLMARQREYLSSQQAMNRMPMQGVPVLNHHSSAHSLHSQPSYGSMTSPITAPPQAPIGPIGTGGSFFDSLATRQPAAHGNSGPGLDVFREDELTHLTGTERQVLASMHNNTGVLGGSLPQQSTMGVPSPESGNRSQLPTTNELDDDKQGFRERLQEFNILRAQLDEEERADKALASQLKTTEESQPSQPNRSNEVSEPIRAPERANESERAKHTQKMESAAPSKEFKEYQQAQAAAAAAKLSGLPMPFPPPPSATPLPAPAPQRVRSNLPEQYATSSRSGTPDVSPATSTQLPPLAPWAKDGGVESHKGPSLKEIQQAEALKAAKAEELAAQARRLMFEQEAAREREKAAAVAPGLPTTSTWGTASPVSAGPVSSPWVKPASGRGNIPAPSTPSATTDKKKTLAEIQREEEARKQKARELAAQSGLTSAAGGKRYADLASKTTASSILPGTPSANHAAPTAVASGWATVGAGGKVKAPPTGPATTVRSNSTTGLKPAPLAAPSPRPTLRSTASTAGGGRTEAMDEFNKWLHNQLVRGISGVTDIDASAQTLKELPLMPEIISDAIYAISKTMDGRHFAQEFIRRKKLAEKGIIEKQPASSPSVDTQSSSAGGWNEVAKKSTHKDVVSDSSSIQAAGFKVVPSRKKGKK